MEREKQLKYRLGKRDLIFCHHCCTKGYRNLEKWLEEQKALGNTFNITVRGIFQITDQKLHEKYGINVDDLLKFAYIVLPDTGEVIKIDVIDKHY